MRFLKQSQSAEQLESGDTLGFLNFQFAAKYQNARRRDPLATKQFRKKVPQCRKKFKGGL